MNDIDTLARTLMGEAKPNDMTSATAIACVIMNRVHFPNWPDSAGEVCLQSWQFSCWNENDPNRARIMAIGASSKWFRECTQIAADAVNGKIDDFTIGATHYHMPSVSPKWARKKVPCYRHTHMYYNDIDTVPTTPKEALDEVRPLKATRTVKGGQVAVASTLGAGGLIEFQEQIQTLIPFLEYLYYAFMAGSLSGIGAMLWARFKDRVAGLR